MSSELFARLSQPIERIARHVYADTRLNLHGHNRLQPVFGLRAQLANVAKVVAD